MIAAPQSDNERQLWQLKLILKLIRLKIELTEYQLTIQLNKIWSKGVVMEAERP